MSEKRKVWKRPSLGAPYDIIKTVSPVDPYSDVIREFVRTALKREESALREVLSAWTDEDPEKLLSEKRLRLEVTSGRRAYFLDDKEILTVMV